MFVVCVCYYCCCCCYFPEDGIAWDWVNKKLYWTDAGDRDLEVYDPRTGFRKVIFQFGATALPRAIIVDPSTKYDTELEWIPIM